MRFSTEIAVHLGNGARYAHGYYVTFIDPCRCRDDLEWPLTRISRSHHLSKPNSLKMVRFTDKLTIPIGNHAIY